LGYEPSDGFSYTTEMLVFVKDVNTLHDVRTHYTRAVPLNRRLHLLLKKTIERITDTFRRYLIKNFDSCYSCNVLYVYSL